MLKRAGVQGLFVLCRYVIPWHSRDIKFQLFDGCCALLAPHRTPKPTQQKDKTVTDHMLQMLVYHNELYTAGVSMPQRIVYCRCQYAITNCILQMLACHNGLYTADVSMS